MATKLSIVTYPEKVLKHRATEISPSPEIAAIIPQMIETMYMADGIGLAAPQVGISKRIIIVETSEDPRAHTEERKEGIPGKALAFLNPTITGQSKETEIAEEGCLSLPGLFVPIKRAEQIHLICQTPEGDTVKIEAAGLVARIFQHEVDHLNGKLIIDHLTPFQRLKLRKQLKEITKNANAQ